MRLVRKGKNTTTKINFVIFIIIFIITGCKSDVDKVINTWIIDEVEFRHLPEEYYGQKLVLTKNMNCLTPRIDSLYN